MSVAFLQTSNQNMDFISRNINQKCIQIEKFDTLKPESKVIGSSMGTISDLNNQRLSHHNICIYME